MVANWHLENIKTRIPSGMWSRLYGLLTQSKICAPRKNGKKVHQNF